MLMKVEYKRVPEPIVETFKERSMQHCTLIEEKSASPVLNTTNLKSIYIDEVEVIAAHEEEMDTVLDIIVTYFITDTYSSMRKQIEHNKEKISVAKQKNTGEVHKEKCIEQVKIELVNNSTNIEFATNRAIGLIYTEDKNATILDIDIRETHEDHNKYMIIIKYTTKR